MRRRRLTAPAEFAAPCRRAAHVRDGRGHGVRHVRQRLLYACLEPHAERVRGAGMNEQRADRVDRVDELRNVVAPVERGPGGVGDDRIDDHLVGRAQQQRIERLPARRSGPARDALEIGGGEPLAPRSNGEMCPQVRRSSEPRRTQREQRPLTRRERRLGYDVTQMRQQYLRQRRMVCVGRCEIRHANGRERIDRLALLRAQIAGRHRRQTRRRDSLRLTRLARPPPPIPLPRCASRVSLEKSARKHSLILTGERLAIRPRIGFADCVGGVAARLFGGRFRSNQTSDSAGGREEKDAALARPDSSTPGRRPAGAARFPAPAGRHDLVIDKN